LRIADLNSHPPIAIHNPPSTIGLAHRCNTADKRAHLLDDLRQGSDERVHGDGRAARPGVAALRFSFGKQNTSEDVDALIRCPAEDRREGARVSAVLHGEPNLIVDGGLWIADWWVRVQIRNPQSPIRNWAGWRGEERVLVADVRWGGLVRWPPRCRRAGLRCRRSHHEAVLLRRRRPDRPCCSLDSITDAQLVAHKLGIPHYVLNFEDRLGAT